MRSLYVLRIVAFCVGVVVGHIVTSRVMPSSRARAEYRIDTLRVVEARLDTVYKARVVTAERWRTQYDTARVMDTVMRADTVYMRRDVADSTVASCYAIVETCEARVANLREQVDEWQDVAAKESASRQRWRWVASVLAVSVGLTFLR